MNINYNFKLITEKNGTQSLRCDIHPAEYILLESFLWVFPSFAEIKWIKSEILKELEKENPLGTGLNHFNIRFNEENTTLFHSYSPNNACNLPIQVVLSFIDEIIEFYELYSSGGIPGIIPESKKDEWIIVPKEFVKDDYWNNMVSEEE